MAKDNILLLLHKTKRSEKTFELEIQDNPATVFDKRRTGAGAIDRNAAEFGFQEKTADVPPERGKELKCRSDGIVKTREAAMRSERATSPEHYIPPERRKDVENTTR